MHSESDADGLDNFTSSILTDLHVAQAAWWATRTTVFRAQRGTSLLSSLRNTATLISTASRFDVVIVSSVRNALALGLAKAIGLARRPRIMTIETRLDERASGVRWRLKVALQRLAFRQIDLVCVSARAEIQAYSERLGLPADRFRFVPWHTNVLEPSMCRSHDGYIFSAGRTGRDWVTFSAAVQNVGCPVVVVCDGETMRRVAFPQHVKVEADVPYSGYRELLLGARLVVVALKERVYSSGQVVILEAMAVGKPVVATRVVGSADYIEDGVTGLLVPPNDPGELRSAILSLVDDEAFAECMSRKALATVIERHTLDTYLRTIEGIAEQLVLDQPECRVAKRRRDRPSGASDGIVNG